MFKSVCSLFFALLIGALPAQAADDTLKARFAQRLKGVLPDSEITSIKPGPVGGLYEVMLGATLIYMSEDGRYVVRGDIFDLDTKANLSDARRSSARAGVFHDLKTDNLIEFPATGGKTRRTLYVFTDIDCAYCRKFHREVPQLNNAGITVRYLAFPRTGLNTPSYQKAVDVWCAADRRQALTDAKLGKTLPAGQCKNPVANEFHLGESVGVHGTPALYTEDGEELGGYIPSAELIHMLLGNG